jgi:hypothetical protein
MLDFGPGNETVEILREEGHRLLRSPLPDDNDLLATLENAGYLRPARLTGYLPGALYFYHGQPDEAEILVDVPAGRQGLLDGPGLGAIHSSLNNRLRDLRGLSFRPLAIHTGYVVEAYNHIRTFLPDRYHAVDDAMSLGRITFHAIDDACTSVGITKVEGALGYVSSAYKNQRTVSFWEAMNVAARWVGYTVRPPWNPYQRAYFHRPLTRPEAVQGLRRVLDQIHQNQVADDIAAVLATTRPR